MYAPKKIITWALISSFFLIENMINFSLTVIKSDLQQTLTLSEEQFAYLASAFIMSYSVFMIPAGILLDRFSMKVVVPVSIFVFTLGCFIFGISHHFYVLTFARVLMGVGAAFSLLSSLKYARSFFSQHLAFFSGLGLSFGMIGAIIAKTPIYYLYELAHHQKHYLFLMFTLIGLLLMVVLRLLLEKDGSTAQDKYSMRHVREVISDQGFWLIALYGALMYTPLLVLEMAWLHDFLGLLLGESTHHVINSIESAPFLGVILGSIVFGYISDRSKSRKLSLLICALLTAITLELFFLGINRSVIYNFTILLLFGFFTGGFMPSFAYLAERYAVEVAGCATGLMNFINMLGGSFVMPILGRKIDFLSSQEALTQFEIYQMTLLFLPFLAVVAAVCIVRVKKN